MLIKADIRIPAGRPVPELADFARRCEDAGLHGAGFHDHHHTGRDAYVALAAAALSTERLTLYPATSNVVTRHPLVLAALAQSVAELAPGRVMITLAPGFRSVEEAGEQHATRARLREAVSAVRGLLAGRTAELNGTRLRLDNLPPSPVRVLLTASGPRLLELAGEVADGALMLVGLDRRAVDAAREHLRAGAERAGRDPSQLQQVFIVPLALGEPDEAAEWPRRYFRPGRPWLSYPSSTKLHWLRLAGVPLPADPRPEDIPAAQARRICDALGLFGPAGYCADRLLRAREEAGIDHVFLFPEHTAETSYVLPEAEIGAFRQVIAPRLA
jgi:5,10-methylenetetrahydromethanopterin reductase